MRTVSVISSSSLLGASPDSANALTTIAMNFPPVSCAAETLTATFLSSGHAAASSTLAAGPTRRAEQ
jgi:hypothetical protein